MHKAGYQEIISDADKAKFDAIFDEFMDALKNPELVADHAAMDKKVLEIDDKFRHLQVRRRAWSERSQSYRRIAKGPMLYAAPNSMLLYARNPELYDSQAIRYVADLMHADQKKAD